MKSSGTGPLGIDPKGCMLNPLGFLFFLFPALNENLIESVTHFIEISYGGIARKRHFISARRPHFIARLAMTMYLLWEGRIPPPNKGR